jgi:hypothetical protein
MPRTGPATLLRAASGLMAGLFAFSVWLQHNDPDPARWMAIYGAAALVAGQGALARGPAWPGWLVAVAAGAWAASLAPAALAGTSWGRMVASWHMVDAGAELGRELGGLAIVVAWCVVVALARRRARRPR